MGRQVSIFALDDDERVIWEVARQHGAVLVGDRKHNGGPQIVRPLEEPLPPSFDRLCYLWIPDTGPLVWSRLSETVDPFQSSVIEVRRSRISPEGKLVNGRVYVQTTRLVDVDGVPQLEPADERLIALYNAIRRRIERSFHRHKHGWTHYIGPLAMAWHKAGGSLYGGMLGEIKVDR